jgi:hypothetical protein
MIGFICLKRDLKFCLQILTVSFLIVECNPLDYLNLSGHHLSIDFAQALKKSVRFVMEREMPTPNV